jgi:hypothetical protein
LDHRAADVWEALTAIGTISSAIVITVTVILTARQVRATVSQLEQVRRATQFEAARTVLMDLADPAFAAAYRFVFHDLKNRMADGTFRREVALIGTADLHVHQELVLLRSLDRIGAYIRFGLVDREIVYTTYRWRILICWENLSDVVAIHRHVAGEDFWENAEYLYDDCRRWSKERNKDVDMVAARRRVDDASTERAPA